MFTYLELVKKQKTHLKREEASQVLVGWLDWLALVD